MLKIRCVNCQGESQVAPESIGQVVACPHCGKPTPATQQEATPPPPPTQAPPPPPPAKTPATKPPPPPPPAPSLASSPSEVETPAPAKPQAEIEPEEIAPTEPEPKKPLTREQQLARRAKLKLLLAIGSALLLAIIAVVLAKLGQP
ncbi:MAG: hypothetical protein RH917_05215 [Lacipirellulaceae bacterium]